MNRHGAGEGTPPRGPARQAEGSQAEGSQVEGSQVERPSHATGHGYERDRDRDQSYSGGHGRTLGDGLPHRDEDDHAHRARGDADLRSAPGTHADGLSAPAHQHSTARDASHEASHPHPDSDRPRAHAHEHSHAHSGPQDRSAGSRGLRAFALGTLINLAFTALEAVYGVVTGSLALLSDALHNLGDALGLALAWGAAWLARKPASARRTYGYRRATLLAPLANSLLLVAGAGALGWEALRRIGEPPALDALPVIVVAALGIVVNTGCALLFRHGHAHDINERGAYLHLMADAAVSLAVVLGGCAMYFFGWHWLDPVLAALVTLVIVYSSWGLLRDSADLALDAVPRGIDHGLVQQFLESRPGVVAVHHLHIWALGSREVALTAHIVRPADADSDAFIDAVGAQLRQRFGIGHATLQLERQDGRDGCVAAE